MPEDCELCEPRLLQTRRMHFMTPVSLAYAPSSFRDVEPRLHVAGQAAAWSAFPAAAIRVPYYCNGAFPAMRPAWAAGKAKLRFSKRRTCSKQHHCSMSFSVSSSYDGLALFGLEFCRPVVVSVFIFELLKPWNFGATVPFQLINTLRSLGILPR